MAKRVILRILLLILIIVFIYVGISKSEILEIFRNSNLLCLSCIGIQ